MARQPLLVLAVTVPLLLLAGTGNAAWSSCITDPPQEALVSCTKMIETFSKPGHIWATALRERAIAHLDLKNYRETIADLDRLIAERFGTAEDYALRSDAHSWLGDWEKTLADAEEAFKLDPANPAFKWRVAVAESETDRYDNALRRFIELREAYPWDALLESKIGLVHYRLGRLDDALKGYKLALAVTPGDSALWVDRGVIEHELDRREEAVSSLGEAIRVDPRNANAFYWRARVRLAQDEVALALKDIEAAIALDPSLDNRLQRAYINLAAEDAAAARKDLEEARRLPGLEAEKTYIEGRIHAVEGKFEAALEAFARTLAQDSEFTSALYESARAHRALGDNKKAEEQLTAVLARWPEDSQSYYLRAGARLDLDDLDGALADANDAARLNPGSAFAFARRSAIYTRKMLYEKASADCRKALSIDPENADALSDCASAAWRLDELERALADYDVLLKRFPDDAALIGERAELLFAMERKAEAFAEAERAVRKNPASPDALLHRGAILEQDGQFQASFNDYEKAIGLDPENGWGYEARAYWFIGEGQIAQALADCKTMAEKLPKAPASYRCLSRASWEAGEMKDAMDFLDKARTLNENYGPAYYDRAVMQRQHGLYEEALSNLSTAVSLSFRKTESLILRGDTHWDLGDTVAALRDYKAAAAIARKGWKQERAQARVAAAENRNRNSSEVDSELYPNRRSQSR